MQRKSVSRGAKWAIGVIALLVVVAGIAAFALIRTGAVVPGDAAARYADGEFIDEQRVTDYVASYRRQQGLEGSSDEMWASFLAENDLTPETLRVKVIQQLVVDEMVKKKAAEYGAEVDEDEFREFLDTFKGNLAFGDEETYRDTLAMQGQTVEQAEEGFRNLFLQQALFEKAVEREDPTDEQLQTGLSNAYPDGVCAKHIYRCSIEGIDEGEGYEHVTQAASARSWFAEGDRTIARFAECVQRFCTDEDMLAAQGDDGWSIDMSGKSDEYQGTVEALEPGEVSNTFIDGDEYSFLWVGESIDLLPADDGSFDLADVPESLLENVRSGISEQYWELDCQVYLQQLLAESGLEVFAMPSDVPYNVDMSLADAS